MNNGLRWQRRHLPRKAGWFCGLEWELGVETYAGRQEITDWVETRKSDDTMVSTSPDGVKLSKIVLFIGVNGGNCSAVL